MRKNLSIKIGIFALASSFISQMNAQLDSSTQAVNEVVITGVSKPKNTLESSISITTLSTKSIQNSVARTTAEIFRTIPGIRAESSGGEGNSNITVRGVPVSAGGSRYMLLQEDGLPVLQFGDIAFGTQDQFIRYDNTVSRIEALRGGSASIMASNSPAGIINFISKNGETEGGSITTSLGINFQNLRTDFEYGSSLGNNLFFHIGGFYRAGDGPRKAGFISNNGGQLKANLTKKYANGFIRLNGKFLDDRTAAYMPMPLLNTGTEDAPVYTSLGDYNALTGTLQSPQLINDLTIGGDGNVLRSDVRDGMHSVSKSVGMELNFDLGDGWNLNNKGRMAFNSGQFLAPFPSEAGPMLAGATYNDDGSVASGYYAKIHLFNTKLNNFNNYANDFSLTKAFTFENGTKLNIKGGLYKAYQNINMDWHWNTYQQELNSVTGNRLINTAGSNNGQLAYGVPAWGNCCSRNYNTSYNINAPYAQIELTPNTNWNFDAGIRYDLGEVRGQFSGATGKTVAKDMNGNGVIDSNERNVSIAAGDGLNAVNYDYDLLSYSVGGNYKINTNQSLFARFSNGGSASADRILFNGYNYSNTNDPALGAQKVNTVKQLELGTKYRKNKTTLNITGFYANTTESNYEATTQLKRDNSYESFGVELDGITQISKEFSLRGGLTYTNARITASIDTTIIDNTPRRTPDFMINLTPAYTKDNFSIGFTSIMYTKSFTQDNNKLVMPGYIIVNPFLSLGINNKMTIGLQANNVFNSLAITEAEEGTNPSNGIIRARPLLGASFSGSFRYIF